MRVVSLQVWPIEDARMEEVSQWCEYMINDRRLAEVAGHLVECERPGKGRLADIDYTVQ